MWKVDWMMGVRENKVCSMIYKFWLGQWSKCMCHLLSWRRVEGGKNFSISVPVTISLKWICVCVCVRAIFSQK